jgi:hypothetical protein
MKKNVMKALYFYFCRKEFYKNSLFLCLQEKCDKNPLLFVFSRKFAIFVFARKKDKTSSSLFLKEKRQQKLSNFVFSRGNPLFLFARKLSLILLFQQEKIR